MQNINSFVKNHYVIVFFILFLSFPTLLSLKNSKVDSENRTLSAWPAWPAQFAEFIPYTRQIEAWTNDHFGLRQMLIQKNNYLHYKILHELPSSQVVVGQNGRIFLGSHSPQSGTIYSAILEICGWPKNEKHNDEIAHQVGQTFTAFAKSSLKPKVAFIPSAPRIYFEDLPAWLQDLCQTSHFAMDEIFQKIAENPALQNQVYYPIDKMLAKKKEFQVFSKSWFHWRGLAPRYIAEDSAKTLWNRDHGTEPLKVLTVENESDIKHLFLGVHLASEIQNPDLINTKIKTCIGPSCIPGLEEEFKILEDVSVFANSESNQGTLILITDSYGSHIAPWYAPYFGQVIHFSTNNLARLSPAQLQNLKSFIFKTEKDHFIEFLYHDDAGIGGRFSADAKVFGF